MTHLYQKVIYESIY